MLQSITVAFATVFVAELGDKSQLVAMSLTAQYSRRLVLAALLAVSAATMGLAVAVGSAVGRVVPTDALTLAAGLLFLGFAWTTFRDDDDEEDDAAPGRGRSFVAVVAALFLAELGDKTMLAALALAATSSALGVWVGAAAGMATASGLAVLVGAALWRRLEPRTVRLASAALFGLVGLALVVEGVLALVGVV